MPIIVKDYKSQRLSQTDLAAWKDIPTAVVCDTLDRTGGMVADIQSLVPGKTFSGQALTVHAPNGTNAPLHHAVELAWPGCALVVDAENLQEKAVWGSVVNSYALSCGITALVFDGCVRDAALLKESDMPIFCRGTAPNGPSKEDIGGVNIPITCGGVAVHPGDILFGDDDGIVVANAAEISEAIPVAEEIQRKEELLLTKMGEGVSLLQMLNFDEHSEKVRAGEESRLEFLV